MTRGTVAALWRGGVALGALGWAATASGQTAGAPQTTAASRGLEDVVVTAQGRVEKAQAVPVALTALTGDTLAVRQRTATVDLAADVPNLVAVHSIGLGSANTYYLRGRGSDVTTATIDPPVATFFDGIYLPRQNASNLRLFDVDRVEVLRGPQGLLFGRNTSAGVIDVVAAPPSDALHGYLEGGYGAYNQAVVRGGITLPLATGFAFKLSGYYQRDDGYVHDTTTGERLNTDRAAGLRAAVHLDLTDALSWDTAVTYMRDNGTNLINFTCDPNRPANCNGRFASTGLRANYDLAHLSPFVALGVTGRKANFGLGNSTDTLLYASNLAWTGESYTLRFVTGVVDTKQKYAIDLTDGRGTPFPSAAVPVPPARDAAVGYDVLNDGSHNAFSQEIKLSGQLLGGRLDYLTGFLYSTERNSTDAADIAGSPAGAVLLADRTIKNGTDAVAGYAQLDFHATRALTVTGGVRYTDERQTFTISDNRPQCQAALLPGCLGGANLVVSAGGVTVPIPLRQTSRQWTPRVVASYQLPDLLLFASASRGYRSGGWDGRGLTPASLLPFAPENAWSYEGGIKSEFFDHRLRVNVTGFYEEAKNVAVSSERFTTAVPVFSTQTVGGLRNRGVEVEVTARPTPRVNLFATLGYQHARYQVSGRLTPDQYGVASVAAQQAACRAELAGGGAAPDCAAGIVDARGNISRPLASPDYTLAGGATYDFPIPAAGVILQPGVTVRYTSDYATGTAGDIAVTGGRSNAHALVDAALRLRTDDDNWTLSVECRNCTGKAVRETTFLGYDYLGPPRRWLVSAKRVF